MAIPAGIQQYLRGGVKIGRLYLGRHNDEDQIGAGLTAFAGGGQTNATQLNGTIEVIDTVATAADSVKLPGCEVTRTMIVVNNGANACQVFAKETSGVTINGVAGATGVSLPAGQMVLFVAFESGKWAMTPSEGTLSQVFASLTLTGLLFESATDSITAHAGGGQGSATALTTELNRITTVATAGDSVKLPASAPGLTIIIENAGANAMQVFGAGTDTINGVATATGVSQMAGSVVIYTCYTAGAWFANGLGTGYSGSLETMSYVNAVSAAGNSQANATQLTAMLNMVTTVAAGTGVNLPANASGLNITIANLGANPLTVYPLQGATDTINGQVATTGTVILPGAIAVFVSDGPGAWVVQPATTTNDAYNTNAATSGTTLTAANVTGGAASVVLNMTGALGAGANAQLPTVAAMLAALHAPAVGTSFRLRIINSSSGAFSWTVTTNTGWTLNGTMTVAQNTWREFDVKITGVGGSAAATLQNVGTGTFS